MQIEDQTKNDPNEEPARHGRGFSDAPCWAISGDGETWSAADLTREEALREGAALYGNQSFWIGRCEPPIQPEQLWDADDWIEHVACQDEYCIDGAEDWPIGITKAAKEELQTEVRKVMAAWLDRTNNRPLFRVVSDPEEITPNAKAQLPRTGSPAKPRRGQNLEHPNQHQRAAARG